MRIQRFIYCLPLLPYLHEYINTTFLVRFCLLPNQFLLQTIVCIVEYIHIYRYAPYIFTMYRYILRSSLLNFSIELMNPRKMKVSATAVRSATQFKTPFPSFFSCRLNFDIITQQAFSNA